MLKNQSFLTAEVSDKSGRNFKKHSFAQVVINKVH